ncbi:lysine 5,6-aminomutase subunit beta [Pelosinus propionicus]|uniref:Beta-lysine 5,6-aminomutase beta subunit n=1 Tax=Pelosinus propionicus DSM 13327 TaxID=1123291 RepID=A0A1I4LLK1_9FIRM|nr:OAM dimerization domain-containing protein [Pelosinus propionicus]SFL91447.1 beta-lysine 5,6-aminomutase beta subunit [Pelosinus propionicus DSM 13327]
MVNVKYVKPYGDTLNDGMVQLAFTLPIPLSNAAKEAARQLTVSMGLEEVAVAHAEGISDTFSFFIVYGKCSHGVNLDEISIPEVALEVLSKKEIDDFIRTHLKRKLNVVGACIESDAHTVGIDAIMNIKGFNGHKGLESYHEINAVNMGAQVACEEVIHKVYEIQADAILISQVVTQKNIHITNLTRLVDMLEAEGLRDKVTLVVGGPRISHELAKELGYDAGFSSNTYAEHVASFLVQEVKRKTIWDNDKETS